MIRLSPPRRVLHAIIGIAGAAGLAELAARAGLVDSEVIPPVSVVLRRAAGLLADAGFGDDVAVTLEGWIAGLLLAVAVGVPAGLVLGQFRALSAAASPLVEFLRTLSPVSLIPLAIVMFPETFQMKVFLTFFAALWPILVNTLYALRDVDPVAKDTLKSFGFGPLSVLWRVSLPSAAPFVMTGVRIAASVGLIVIVSGELLAGDGTGIGGYITETQSSGGHTDLMLAAALWTGVIGVAANSALVRMERRAFRWRAAA
ncbi:ABC transporter permease [Actinocorallia longicatena]|uniref:ABC transporter permease n=1 Tax=Actinocorallia longicatena TaxID=111803 RepID=A0ABP6QJ04_9ACTN